MTSDRPPIFASNDELAVLMRCSTDWTAHSTTPLDPLLSLGANSTMVAVRLVHRSVLIMMPRPLLPHSAMSSDTIRAAQLRVDP